MSAREPGRPARGDGPARARALFRLARPEFLLGGLLLHSLGIALALAEGALLSLAALAWGQLAVTAGQLLTHFSNDYYDQAADRLHTRRPRWSGGSGVLPEGGVPPRWALRAAQASAAVAGLATLVLAAEVRPGLPTLLLLGLAIVLAWGYSSPPLRLHASGFGELAGAFLLAVLTPLIGYQLQGGAGLLAQVPLLLPLAALQLAMLIVVSLPDAPSDAAAGKRTLAVRLGPRRAAPVAVGAMATAYAMLPILGWAGVELALLAAYAVWAPLALVQARGLLGGAGEDAGRWDRLAFWSIGLVMGSAAGLGMVLVVGAPGAWGG